MNLGTLRPSGKDHKGINAEKFDFRWNVRNAASGTTKWVINDDTTQKVLTGITIYKGSVTNADPDGDGTDDVADATWHPVVQAYARG